MAAQNPAGDVGSAELPLWRDKRIAILFALLALLILAAHAVLLSLAGYPLKELDPKLVKDKAIHVYGLAGFCLVASGMMSVRSFVEIFKIFRTTSGTPQ